MRARFLLLSLCLSGLWFSAPDGVCGPVTACAEPHHLKTLTRLRALTYAERDGEKLLADVYMPPGKGPFPAVLMVHGGAWAVGSKWHMLIHSNELAQHGYTVVAINYRLAPKHKFPAQLDDCRAALQWMKNNAEKYRIDFNHVGGYGYSAGGHLISLLAVTQSKAKPKNESPGIQLRAVVAGGAPCNFDWIEEQSDALAYFLGASRAKNPEIYRRASPLAFASAKAPPFFFFHSRIDRVVPIASSRALHESLRRVGVPSAFHTVPKKGHVLAFHDEDARAKAIAFLDRNLKPKPADEEERGGEAKGDKAESQPAEKQPEQTSGSE